MENIKLNNAKSILGLLKKSKILDSVRLSERERIIINKFWYENISFKQISNEIKLSYERVIQIYRIALIRIFSGINNAICQTIVFVFMKQENEKLERENKNMKFIIDSNLIDKDVLIKIKDIDFSVRIKNICKALDIEYLNQFTKYTDKGILSFRNLGNRSLTDIKDVLNKYGLNFKGENKNNIKLENIKSEILDLFTEITSINNRLLSITENLRISIEENAEQKSIEE